MAASADAVWAEDEHDELPPLPQMLARGKQSRAAKAAERGTAAKGSLSYTEWCKFMTQEEARIHCETVIATAQPITVKSKRRSNRPLRVGYDRRRGRRACWDGGHGVDAGWRVIEDHANNRNGGAAGSHGHPRPVEELRIDLAAVGDAQLDVRGLHGDHGREEHRP